MKSDFEKVIEAYATVPQEKVKVSNSVNNNGNHTIKSITSSPDSDFLGILQKKKGTPYKNLTKARKKRKSKKKAAYKSRKRNNK